jgi:UDP-N-acetylglucosamine transferase subunit ALG13
VIFVTVGTQFPFDRLIRAVDEAAGKGLLWEETFAQVGVGGYRPGNMKWAEELPREEYARRMKDASAVIGHAGMGTIATALDAGKPLLVMARLERYGEIVNDHQAATAGKFAELGHVIAAANESEIEAKLAGLREFRPKARRTNAEGVVARVARFLEGARARKV